MSRPGEHQRGARCAYHSGAIGVAAARQGVHQPCHPKGWASIPAGLKNPQGLWWTVHTGSIALIANTAALKGGEAPTAVWRFGSAQGQIRIGDDFDDPLPGFEPYMS